VQGEATQEEYPWALLFGCRWPRSNAIMLSFQCVWCLLVIRKEVGLPNCLWFATLLPVLPWVSIRLMVAASQPSQFYFQVTHCATL